MNRFLPLVLFCFSGISLLAQEFERVFPTHPTGAVSSLGFNSTGQGYYYTSCGQLYYTADRGQSWKENNIEIATAATLANIIVSENAPYNALILDGNNWHKVSNTGQTLERIEGISGFIRANNRRGSEVVAVTSDSRIYYSSDFGETWSEYAIPDCDNILSVDLIAPQQIIVTTNKGQIKRSTDSGATWEEKNEGDESLNLRRVRFFNEDLGYRAHSSTRIDKTEDGGVSWVEVNPSAGTSNIYFLSENIITAVSTQLYYVSTDGGENFERVFTNTDRPAIYRGHFAADESQVYSFGLNRSVRFTSDVASNDWIDLTDDYVHYAYDLDAKDGAVATVDDNSVVWYSAEGENFNHSAPFSTSLNDVLLLNKNKIVVSTRDGLYTSNSFPAFTLMEGSPENVNSIKEDNNGNIYLVTQGAIMRTDESFSSYTTILEREDIYSRVFNVFPDGSLVAVADGELFSSTDQGENWSTKDISRESQRVFGIDFYNTQKGLILYQDSIGFTENGGEGVDLIGRRFYTLQRTTRVSENEIFAVGNAGAATNQGTVTRSVDGGLSWSTVGETPCQGRMQLSFDSSTNTLWSAGIGMNVEKIENILTSNHTVSNTIENDVTIYPNPAQDFIRINNKNQEKIKSINIWDINGRLLFTLLNMTRDNIDINIQSLNNGLYTVQCLTEGGRITRKISVLR